MENYLKGIVIILLWGFVQASFNPSANITCELKWNKEKRVTRLNEKAIHIYMYLMTFQVCGKIVAYE